MAEIPNNIKLKRYIKEGKDMMTSMGDGLYFRIARKKPSWVVRYVIAGKRAQIALPQSFPTLSISEARVQAINIRQQVKIGIDPKSERKKTSLQPIHNVNQLFDDWYESYLVKQFKHPEIPARYYRKEIKPEIGVMTIADVTPQHIRTITDKIVDSGRKTVANKTLLYTKQLFNHALKLNLTSYNPAIAFTPKDAGGTEYSRQRALRVNEISYIFDVMRNNTEIFTRDNYLACCLLLCLGCRKGELIAAKWEHIDFVSQVWHCLPNKKKKHTPVQPIAIPLSPMAIAWFKELKVRAANSDYVFPARRASKRRKYISDDTLNHALSKLQGRKVDSKKKPYPNYLEEVEHFTVHDLRRTCRSLLAEIGVDERVAERCLNHKVQGLVGIYDRYHYFNERREALDKLMDYLMPYLDPSESAQTQQKIVGDNFSNNTKNQALDNVVAFKKSYRS